MLQDDSRVWLKLTGSKQLVRVNLQTKENKVIAGNVNKTGYYKIAELVEMPDKSDIPQFEKLGSGSKKKEERKEEIKEEKPIQRKPDPQPIMRKETVSKPSSSSGGGYTMQEVAMHNSDKSPWTVVNGRVYDLTGFLYKHPGGYQVISKAVGRDGTATFCKLIEP